MFPEVNLNSEYKVYSFILCDMNWQRPYLDFNYNSMYEFLHKIEPL